MVIIYFGSKNWGTYSKTTTAMPTTTQTVTKGIDAEEGWASELHCYLSTMQRDMTEKTDLIDWWQVSYFLSSYYWNINSLMCLRTMQSCSLCLCISHSMYFLPRLPLGHVNDYFPAPKRLWQPVVHCWVLRRSLPNELQVKDEDLFYFEELLLFVSTWLVHNQTRDHTFHPWKWRDLFYNCYANNYLNNHQGYPTKAPWAQIHSEDCKQRNQ